MIKLQNEMSEKILLSTLPKTWIFDVDGTIVIHNGHLRPEGDELLSGVRDFFSKIPESDYIILLTARAEKYKSSLENFLRLNGIRFDLILFNMPNGERILFNDQKPSGLKTAFAINKIRDSSLDVKVVYDKRL